MAVRQYGTHPPTHTHTHTRTYTHTHKPHTHKPHQPANTHPHTGFGPPSLFAGQLVVKGAEADGKGLKGRHGVLVIHGKCVSARLHVCVCVCVCVFVPGQPHKRATLLWLARTIYYGVYTVLLAGNSLGHIQYVCTVLANPKYYPASKKGQKEVNGTHTHTHTNTRTNHTNLLHDIHRTPPHTYTQIHKESNHPASSEKLGSKMYIKRKLDAYHTPPLPPHIDTQIHKVGQNRTYALYMTVHLVISLPKIQYIHRIYIYIVLAKPIHTSSHRPC